MKTMKWLAMPVLALALTGTFTSCTEKEEEETVDNIDGDQGGGGEPGSALTPEQNKERLSQIGTDFTKAIPASDFDELDQLARHIKDNYCNDDQAEDVEKWADKCFKALAGATWTDNSSDYASYAYTRRVYQLSQFRAHLTYNENTRKWDVQENTSDLQATCKDQNGQTVVAKLTTSGNTKRVYIGEIETDRDYLNNMTLYEIDRAYIEIPAEINVTLTRGGQTLVSVKVTTDINSIDSQNFDLSKDAASATVSAQFAGYDVQFNRIAAQANVESGAVVNFVINKGGKKLLSAEVTGTGGLPSGLVWGEDIDVNAFEDKIVDVTGKVSVCKLDVLGQLQVTAVCSDAKKIKNQFETADKNRYEASIVQNCAQEANSCFTAQFFYDGSSTAQGRMELEATPNSKGTKYNLEPVIVFPDGSRYNMINESYFNEDNFKSLVDLCDKLTENYENMVENYDD